MQDNILDKSPGAPLEVFAIWTEKLPLDARRRWDAAGLTDSRVEHFWDGRNEAGEWLANHAGAASDWDFSMVFGPEARWDEKPGPLIGTGASVLAERRKLEKELDRFTG